MSREYKIGQSFTFSRIISDDVVRSFAELTFDRNPIHVNESFAEESRFGARIAHGFLVGSMISKILGMDFPGPGTVYLSQSLNFRKPVYIGDFLSAVVMVKSFHEESRKLVLDCLIINQDKETVLDGEAVVIAP